MSLFSFMFKKDKKYTLVISWWGMRGFYALGILKWLEQLGYKEKIEAIYGVSIGAIIGSYRAAGYSAEEIYSIGANSEPFGISSINIFSNKSLLNLDFFKTLFTKDLPKKITDLKIKMFIWATDCKTSNFLLFDTGDLIPILLWSMALPAIFPVVHYKKYVLMDGGVANSFPVKFAKNTYPHHDIIGIVLNKFKENQKIETILDTLSVSFDMLFMHHTIKNIPHLFYKDIPLKLLDTDRKKMHKVYLEWYKDCIKHFKK